VNPDIDEVPGDGVDGDCDGIEQCFEDLDGDGYGTVEVDSEGDTTCTEPGEGTQGGDCDDLDEQVHPGATEAAADGVDSDCDQQEDCYQDADGDGHGGSTRIASDDLDCQDPGEAAADDDCNDHEPLAWTDAPETCDGVDNDCDGEGDGMGVWYVDADLDGFGDPSTRVETCAPEEALVTNGDDCDDERAATHPDARETPNDGIDQDCDGNDKEILVVGACSTSPSPTQQLLPLALLGLLIRTRRGKGLAPRRGRQHHL
jgi:hypothetical protein